jgi:hypothetical protein
MDLKAVDAMQGYIGCDLINAFNGKNMNGPGFMPDPSVKKKQHIGASIQQASCYSDAC